MNFCCVYLNLLFFTLFLEYDLLHPEDEESKFTFTGNSFYNEDNFLSLPIALSPTFYFYRTSQFPVKILSLFLSNQFFFSQLPFKKCYHLSSITC